MRKFVLMTTLSFTALTCGVMAGAVQAQPAPAVTVGVGAELQHKAENLGSRDVDDIRRDLGDSVSRALVRNPGIARADLVIEDAQPNRPTFEQLSRTVGLSFRSIGIGGARISGTVTLADGSVRPLRYQWYETDLRDERAAGTWSDADRSFDYLADALRSGKVPDRYTGPGPSSPNSHFGYPYTGE